MRTDNTQQNSNCRLCSDRDETINYIICEYSKLAQKKYKTKYAWVGKVIHWELCKILKFDHTTKWYRHKPESVLENETHKIHGDFEIQVAHLVSVRRPDLVIMTQKTKQNKKQKQKKTTKNKTKQPPPQKKTPKNKKQNKNKQTKNKNKKKRTFQKRTLPSPWNTEQNYQL